MTENIEDLESSIRLNKEMLRELLDLKPPDISSSDTELCQRSFAIDQLFEENSSLELAIRDSIQELNESNGRSLINEQIYAEYARKEQELEHEYAEKLSEINDQNLRKDRIIGKLTEKKEFLEKQAQSVLTEKSLIIISPTPTIIDQPLQIEERRETMQRLARKVHCAQKLRESLISKCNEIWEDCIKAHALLKNPINRKQGLERQILMALKPPERDFNFEFKYDDETDSEDEFLSPPFPVKNNVKTGNNAVVPSLDFSKLRRDSYSKPGGPERELEEMCKEAHECVEILKTELNALTEKLLKLTSQNEGLLAENEHLASQYSFIIKH